MNSIKERALYRFPKGKGHARHGIVYTFKDETGQIYAVDTYWNSKFSNSPNDGGIYPIEKVASDLQFVMMIDDAGEVGKKEFDLYDYEDKLYIPTGGRCERYLVNKNAKKNTKTVIDYIKYDIDYKQRKITSLNRDIESLQRWLNEIKLNPEIAQEYDNSDYVSNVDFYLGNSEVR